MDREKLMGKVSTIVHAGAGIAIGAVSFTVHDNLIAGGAGILTLLVVGFLMERFSGKKGLKWWAMNGLIVYLFFWLAAWIYAGNA